MLVGIVFDRGAAMAPVDDSSNNLILRYCVMTSSRICNDSVELPTQVRAFRLKGVGPDWQFVMQE